LGDNVDEKNKPGGESSDNGKKLINAPTMTAGETLSATPSFVERQNQPGLSVSSITIGEKFGDYQILRLLGKGGMGEVYEADHLESGRRVALKVLSQSLGSPEDRARFLQEGKLAAQVSHPNCVYVYGTEEIRGIPVISMELAPGGTLKDLLKEQGRLSPEKAVDTILQVVSGLEAAYSTGVLHRDIKPSNCFVDTEGNAKIGDFGLSISTLARAERDVTASGSFVGTPAFSSPEQLRGEDLDVRSDIYSLGVTLYYLLTGNVPFNETNLMKLVSRILEKTAESPRSLYKNIPKGLAGIVMRCLEKKPSARFSNYSDLKKALRPFSSAAMQPAELGIRSNAAYIDLMILAGLLIVTSYVLNALSLYDKESLPTIGAFLFLLYFTILEGTGGRSIGKKIRKIRIVGPNRDSPGIPKSFIRTLIFFFVIFVGGRFVRSLLPESLLGVALRKSRAVISVAIYSALSGLLFLTARRKNGFAGLHDLASNTRVVAMVPARDESVDLSAEEIFIPETKRYIGPYLDLESLRKSADIELILGYDEKLKRKLWIQILPSGAAPLPESRRDVARRGRLRWINGKRTPDNSWDAFEEVEGKPFLHHVSKRNPWPVVRRWLLETVEEIELGLKDGSLPSSLGLDRLWITGMGRVKLLDFPAPWLETGMEVPDPVGAAEGRISVGSIRIFLKQMALSALEGIPRGFDDARTGNPSLPLPLQARTFIQTLRAEKDTSLADLARLLRSWSEKQEINASLRMKRLGAVASYFSFMTLPVSLSSDTTAGSIAALIVLGYMGIVGSLAAFAFRGGVLLKEYGLAVVDSAGTPISRWMAFAKGLLGWSPVILLGLLPSVWNKTWLLAPPAAYKTAGLSFPLWPALALLAIAAAGSIWSVITPERGPHDRIIGTYLVPR